MTIQHVCIRECYYLERHWTVGEVFESTPWTEGCKPGKHFIRKGSSMPASGQPIVIAGDDPRSTAVLREELESKHGIKLPKKTSRKVIFAEWRDAEGSTGSQPAAPKEKTQSMDNVAAPGSQGLVKINDMNPDEIDDITKKEIADRLGVSYTSYNKSELIERAVEAGV